MFTRRSESPSCAGRPTLRWASRSLCAACLLVTVAWGFSKEGMDKDARIGIIRGLLREMAVTKVALPYGKTGVRLDAEGKLDEAAANKELHFSGMAMKAGTPAVITKIEFKERALVFELNNGGKSGEKWYQHIEVGMGGTPRRLVNSNKRLAPLDRRSRWILASRFLTLPCRRSKRYFLACWTLSVIRPR